MVRSDAQLRLADQAPPRPEYPEAGGDHERWKDMRRHWVASWGGKLPPADDVDWKGWWRRAGAQHRDLVAAARKRFGCDAAAPSISGSAFAPALAAATSAGAKASDDPAESAAADASIPNAGTTMQAALPSTLPAAIPAAPPAAAPRAAAPLPVLPVAAPSARAAACPVVGSARPTAKLDSASVERVAAFLKSTQSTPLSERIAFLRQKGIWSLDIAVALRNTGLAELPTAAPATAPTAASNGKKPALPLLPRRPARVRNAEANARRQATWELEHAAAKQRRDEHQEQMAERHKRQMAEAAADATYLLQEHTRRFHGVSARALEKEIQLMLGDSAPIDLHSVNRMHLSHCMPPANHWIGGTCWPLEWGRPGETLRDAQDGRFACSDRRTHLRALGYDCPPLEPSPDSDVWRRQQIMWRVAAERPPPYACTRDACVCEAGRAATEQHRRDVDIADRERETLKREQAHLPARDRIAPYIPDVLAELPFPYWICGLRKYAVQLRLEQLMGEPSGSLCDLTGWEVTEDVQRRAEELALGLSLTPIGGGGATACYSRTRVWSFADVWHREQDVISAWEAAVKSGVRRRATGPLPAWTKQEVDWWQCECCGDQCNVWRRCEGGGGPLLASMSEAERAECETFWINHAKSEVGRIVLCLGHSAGSQYLADRDNILDGCQVSFSTHEAAAYYRTLSARMTAHATQRRLMAHGVPPEEGPVTAAEDASDPDNNMPCTSDGADPDDCMPCTGDDADSDGNCMPCTGDDADSDGSWWG